VKRLVPTLLSMLVLAIVAAIPLWALVAEPGACLADPASEITVKMWGFEVFASPARFFGGQITEAGHPNPGLLNNPDMIGTLIVGVLGRVIGSCPAYDLLVYLHLFANGAAAWLLARQWTRSDGAALTAGVSVALLPIVLTYCVMGAITDMLAVWPYLLSFWALRAAWDRGQALYAAAAGALLAVGFMTCPYNTIVFLPAILPLGLGLGWERPEKFGLVPWSGPRPALKLLGAVILGGLLVGASYVIWLKLILADPTSQMSAEAIEMSRHTYPYRALEPRTPDRYFTFIADYFRWDPTADFIRENGSRFHRVVGPGLVPIALGLIGAFLTRGRPETRSAAWLWGWAAVFLGLASAGPYLAITQRMFVARPVNIVWMGLHELFPGVKMLLEPFRYALPVGVCVALAASLGVAALTLRFGRWVPPVAVALVLAERLLMSPVPLPLPTWRPEVPAVYAELDDILPVGAIIELPFFVQATRLFYRAPFLHQRAHGRPIALFVEGRPPPYLMENPLTGALIGAEGGDPIFGPPPASDGDMVAGQAALVADGFAGIIISPRLYRYSRQRTEVKRLLEPLGRPVKKDDRWIYRLK
jgi:hypothetical protein